MSAVKRTRIKRSKNRKKTWMKYTDIKEVEEYLEEKRLQERIGEKDPNQTSFIIEKTNTPSTKKSTKSKEIKQVVKKPLRTTLDIVSTLFPYKSLELKSRVKPAINPIPGPKPKHKLLDSQNFKSKWTKRVHQINKSMEDKKRIADEAEHPELRLKFYDIWADEDKVGDSELAELMDKQKQLIGEKPPKIRPRLYQQPSLLPPVEAPHPGMSYNPTFEDHQNLLAKAHEVEVLKLREELHLKRVLDDKFPKAEDAPTEKTWLKEMSQGLGLESEDESIYEPKDEELTMSVLMKPIRRENKKLKSQRRREKMKKEAIRKSQAHKSIMKRESGVFKLKKIVKEIKEAEKRSLERQKKKEQKMIDRMYYPHKLSQHKFQELDLPLNLSSEINGSLRKIITDGNLLEDRYKSLQKRNILEPRIKSKPKRKYKLQEYVKRSHKESNDV